MRFMMIVKADQRSEAGILPTEQELADMAKYNEQLVKAGVLLAGEGLQASSKGARVRFSAGKPSVIDGPFAESKELIGGFWIIQAKSKEEAVEWARRVPFVDGEIEIRQVFELEDFGPGEAVEHHRRLFEQVAKR
ncbi:MAG: YciI family protein [Gemmatimonadetes bacterium]|nr:YciI family protein [Gemmatimonadota bacterium]